MKTLKAQDSATLAVFSRYHQLRIEVKFIPSSKEQMQLGLNNGYVIERSEGKSSTFLPIATIRSYTKAQWEDLIKLEEDTSIKSRLEMVMDILFAPKGNDGPISLEDGIGELKEARNKEGLAFGIYIMAALQSMKGAEALGLGFTDKNIKEGSSYKYRIRMSEKSNISGETEVNASKILVTNGIKIDVFPGEHKISFAWTPSPNIAGYLVERAEGNSNKFTSLTNMPFYDTRSAGFEGKSNGAFSDDSVINYRIYKYRFYGFTPFGEKLKIAEVTGMARDFTAPEAPLLLSPKHLKSSQVKLTWKQPDEAKDIKGYLIGRSNKDSGAFNLLHTKLLSPTTRTYTDTTVVLNGTNYYVVYVFDTAGNMNASYPAYVMLIDSTPPSIPEWISGKMDSNGVVTLKIKPGKENDLKGYRVYKSNAEDHEFSVFKEDFKTDKFDSTVLTYSFIDSSTLHSLTPAIYYKIRALDYQFNQSDFSMILKVKRPDIIPPVSSQISDVVVHHNKVQLNFIPGTSEDMIAQLLYRKMDTVNAWSQLAILPKTYTQYEDTMVLPGHIYYYTIRALDDDSLFSEEATPVFAKPYDNGIRPGVTNLKADTTEGGIRLKWQYINNSAEVVFAIYKRLPNGQLQWYVQTSNREYFDKQYLPGTTYAIKVLTEDGGKSKMSEEVK